MIDTEMPRVRIGVCGCVLPAETEPVGFRFVATPTGDARVLVYACDEHNRTKAPAPKRGRAKGRRKSLTLNPTEAKGQTRGADNVMAGGQGDAPALGMTPPPFRSLAPQLTLVLPGLVVTGTFRPKRRATNPMDARAERTPMGQHTPRSPKRSGEAGAAREGGVRLPARPASPLDRKRDQVRLLHGPNTFDQMGDGNAVWFTDAEHDQGAPPHGRSAPSDRGGVVRGFLRCHRDGAGSACAPDRPTGGPTSAAGWGTDRAVGVFIISGYRPGAAGRPRALIIQRTSSTK